MNINTILTLTTVLLSVPTAALATIDTVHRRRAHGAPIRGASQVAASHGGIVAGASFPPQGTTWAPPRADISVTVARHVSFPRRVLSYLIDIYAWAFIAAALDLALVGSEQYETEGPTGIGVIVAWIGLSAIVARTGRSPGKLLVGARLIPVDDPDGRVSTWRAMWRYLVASVASFLLISQFAALGNPERITLHDRWTKTRVVRTR